MSCRMLSPLLVTVALGASESDATTFVDTVDFGSEASATAHAVRDRGTVRVEALDTEMGALRRTYRARTLLGTESQVQFTVRRPQGEGPLLLEVEEIHHRRPLAFGYTVAINGTATYFRTYEELGDGPNHYFIHVPPALAAAAGQDVTVTLTSAGPQPFSIAQVWLYQDFAQRVDAAEQVYRPMALLGSFTKPAAHEPPLTSFGPLGYFDRPHHYANTPTATFRAELRAQLTLSATTGRPVQFLANGMSWGGAPAGPDGRGGYFNDIRYSALSYDRQRAAFSPSFPNMWGSTFWAAYHEPHMNEILRGRFLASMRDLMSTIDLLKAHGHDPQPILLREMGTPLAEVTPATMAAAARDGVALDPRDGLDAQERLWLYRHAVGLWQSYAQWHDQVVQRDSVVVDRGEVRLPRDQLVENQYFHTVFRDLGPMQDKRWFGGQTAMMEGFWSSGEMFWEEFTLYDYLKANGKLAHANLEATILKKQGKPLRNLYASGFQHVNFFNDAPEFIDSIRAADGCDGLPALPIEHHEPVLFQVRYGLHATLGPNERIVSSSNLKIVNNGRENADSISTSRLTVENLAAPGAITYRLDNGGEPFPAGLSLELDGRIAPGAGNHLRVLVGETPEQLQSVAVLTANELPCPDHWTPFMTSLATVDLGRSMVGRTQVLVRFEIGAQGAEDATFLLQSRVTSQWPRRSGYLAEAPARTMREERTQQLWIQDRAQARHLLGRFQALGGDAATIAQAQGLYDHGRYRSVQRLLLGAMSEVLPARYAVRGHGRLGRFPVEVRLPHDDQVVVVTLHRFDADGCEVELLSDVERQPVTLSMPVGAAGPWHVEDVGAQRFRLCRGAGEVAAVVEQGLVQVTRDAVRSPEAAPQLPHTMTARLREITPEGLRIDTQDLAAMQGAEFLRLPLAPQAVMTRVAARAQDPQASTTPQPLDRVELQLDAQGRVTQVAATYGYDQGRIARITPPSATGPAFTYGVLELENGQRYEFSYGTLMDTVAMHGRFCAYELRHFGAALTPGSMVQVTYSPSADAAQVPRLIRVAQPYRVLLDQDYQELSDSAWTSAALAVDGVRVGPHIPEPNYLHDIVLRLMRPTRTYSPCSVEYRIEGQRPLRQVVAEFAARAFEDSSRVEFLVSDDRVTWTSCGHFDNTWQNSYPQSTNSKAWKNPRQFIDLSPAVAGKTGFFLKMVLVVGPADERFCVEALRVLADD